MERAAFIVVVTFAILFATWHYWVGPHFNFSSDAPFAHAEAVMPTTQAHTPATNYVATSVNIDHAAAQVTITPEDRADMSVEIDNPGHTPMPTATLANGVLTIDGHLRGRISDCDNGGASLRGYDDVTAAEMPHIIIHAPRTLTVNASGAAYTAIGAAQEVHASFSGCADSTVADVAGPLKLSLAGSGSIHAGTAHGAEVSVEGSGEVFTGAIAGDAKVSIAGSGEVTLASVEGELTTENAGSGNIVVEGGHITHAKMESAGSGDARVSAPIQDLDAQIVGSGDIDVPATVGNVSASIAGSGSVRVQAATGTVHKEIMGSGELTVGH